MTSSDSLPRLVSVLSNGHKPTVYVGTPIEIEASIRRFFNAQRLYFNNLPEDDRKEKLELFDRSAFRVEIVAMDGLAKERVRPHLRTTADQIDLERELFRLVQHGTDAPVEGQDDTGEAQYGV